MQRSQWDDRASALLTEVGNAKRLEPGSGSLKRSCQLGSCARKPVAEVGSGGRRRNKIAGALQSVQFLAWLEGRTNLRSQPIALFLFCVFLMFAVASLTGLGEIPTQVKTDVAEQIREREATLKQQETDRSERLKADRSTVGIDAEIAQTQRELNGLKKLQEKGIEGSAVQVSEDLPAWLGESIGHAARNPELLLYKLKTNAYKFSWALIPISVPFVWLLFPFSRRFHVYDHTVFVTYSLCFMMLLLMAGTLVGLVAPSIAQFAWFIPPIPMYRQLRGTYALTRWGAIWRAVLLTIFAFVAAGVFMTGLVGMGLFD